MGVFGAMLTAVSGLRSQAFALENISGNIANSQTTGFKRVETSFVDLVPDLARRRELAGSVTAFSRGTNTIQGDLTTTSNPTHMALNGQGYFVVAERSDVVGGRPVFSSLDLYTRRGDFELDKDGFLVNGSGYYLKGNSIDPATGAVVGTSGGPIRIDSSQIPATKTDNIDYQANLPSYPATAQADPAVPQSELMLPAGFVVDPIASGTVTGQDQSLFLQRSIAGGSVTVYNEVGAPVNVQMRWAKTQGAAYGGTDTWQLFYQTNSQATGAQVGWERIGTYTFGTNGQMTSAPTVAIPALTVNGVTVGAVNLNTGATGLTQFADLNGSVQASSIRQDGYGAGVLERVAVSGEGSIVGTYSNGQVVPLAQLMIANFTADDALKRRDGGVFEQTLESGNPALGLNGSNIIGGALENSNTDIAEEFSKMIITQQAYSANTRVITTTQQMLQDVINIVR